MITYVVSKDRPQNVPVVESIAGGALVWAVPGRAAEYREAGARFIFDVPVGQAAATNAILDRHAGEWVAFLDDDLRRLRHRDNDGGLREVTIYEAVREMRGAAAELDAGMAAILPYTNAGWASPTRARWGRVMSWLTVVAPGVRSRLDESMPMSFDYDFAARVHMERGMVRLNCLVGDFRAGDKTSHYGQGADRAALTGPAMQTLVTRYPHLFALNPKNEHEVRWLRQR